MSIPSRFQKSEVSQWGASMWDSLHWRRELRTFSRSFLWSRESETLLHVIQTWFKHLHAEVSKKNLGGLAKVSVLCIFNFTLYRHGNDHQIAVLNNNFGAWKRCKCMEIVATKKEPTTKLIWSKILRSEKDCENVKRKIKLSFMLKQNLNSRISRTENCLSLTNKWNYISLRFSNANFPIKPFSFLVQVHFRRMIFVRQITCRTSLVVDLSDDPVVYCLVWQSILVFKWFSINLNVNFKLDNDQRRVGILSTTKWFTNESLKTLTF